MEKTPKTEENDFCLAQCCSFVQQKNAVLLYNIQEKGHGFTSSQTTQCKGILMVTFKAPDNHKILLIKFFFFAEQTEVSGAFERGD